MTTQTATLSRSRFLTVYRDELNKRYAWAQDNAKLDKFMAGVAVTLAGKSEWNHDGEAVTAAWWVIGGKGKPTLKALRATV